jgi:hypothetical protein
MSAIQEVANRHHVAMLAAAHTRKAEAEDFLDAVGGTTGLTATADAVLVLRHPRRSGAGTLELTGRDLPAEQKLELEWSAETAAWSLVGTIADDETPWEQSPVWDQVRHFLGQAGGYHTIREIALGIGRNPDNERDLKAMRVLIGRRKRDGCLLPRGDTYALPGAQE